MLASKEELTDENIRLAHLAGWCVEMVKKKNKFIFSMECEFIKKYYLL